MDIYFHFRWNLRSWFPEHGYHGNRQDSVDSPVSTLTLQGSDQSLIWLIHSSPKQTQVLRGCISFGEDCISVNLTSCIDKIDMTLGQGQWPRINRNNGWIKPVFLLGKSVHFRKHGKSCQGVGPFKPINTALLDIALSANILQVSIWSHYLPGNRKRKPCQPSCNLHPHSPLCHILNVLRICW